MSHDLSEFYFVRHALRLDQVDLKWPLTSPTPYDPPLAPHGQTQAMLMGASIGRSLRYVIHSSPYLRCLQTALIMAKSLHRPILRIDAFLGEWMNPEYFESSVAPPDDMVDSAIYYLTHSDTSSVHVDWAWNARLFGDAGEYGEEWPEMHARFRGALERLVGYYSTPPAQRTDHSNLCTQNEIVIMVTHGAGVNAMISAVSRRPVLHDVGLASISHAVKQGNRYHLLRAACTDHLVVKKQAHSGLWRNRSTSLR